MRVADLFCGAGYFSHGFKEAGYEVDYGIDNWLTAIKTYNKYIGKGRLSDVSQFYPGKKDYDVVVIGGPPCKSFSRANRLRNIFDKRAQLVLDFCRIVDSVKPEAFVFENVIGLAKWAEVALFELKDYKVTRNIVDSAQYGVPQYRKRKIFIGSRDKHIKLQAPRNVKPITVAEAFSNLRDNWGFTEHRPRCARAQVGEHDERRVQFNDTTADG
jgi:DNA (cytosine-5)-methyltransferase 1